MNSKIGVLTLIALVMFSFSAQYALAGFGMSAGSLDYGDIPRGGSKTLQYTLVNTDNNAIQIKPVPEGDFEGKTSVYPNTAIIAPGGSQVLSVTFYMPKDSRIGEVYKGSIYAVGHAIGGPTGAVGASIQLATRKEGYATAGREVNREIPFLLIGVVLALISIFMLMIALIKREQD